MIANPTCIIARSHSEATCQSTSLSCASTLTNGEWLMIGTVIVNSSLQGVQSGARTSCQSPRSGWSLRHVDPRWCILPADKVNQGGAMRGPLGNLVYSFACCFHPITTINIHNNTNNIIYKIRKYYLDLSHLERSLIAKDLIIKQRRSRNHKRRNLLPELHWEAYAI